MNNKAINEFGFRPRWITPSGFCLACVAGSWKQWAKERTDASESPSRAPVFSCAHYFQAPATQAKICLILHILRKPNSLIAK